MRNKKKIIVAFMLVAALCLGIGYAALSDQLNISGTANIEASEAQVVYDADVFFSEAVLKEGPEGHTTVGTDYTISTVSLGEDKDTDQKPDGVEILIENGLAVTGDKFTFTLTIQNDSGADTTVSVKNTLESGEHPSATEYIEAYVVGDKSFSIAKGESHTFDVCVQLLKTVETDLTNIEFGIYLTAISAG